MSTKDQRGFTHHLAIIVVAVLVVGSVGFATWRVRNNKIDAHADTNCTTKKLKRGSSGTCVYIIQAMLSDYLSRTISRDSKFGAQTETAVRDFQTQAGVKHVDGIVGPAETWPALCAHRDNTARFFKNWASCPK